MPPLMVVSVQIPVNMYLFIVRVGINGYQLLDEILRSLHIQ